MAERSRDIAGQTAQRSPGLAAPSAVVAEPFGRLWVADSGHGRVLGMDASGLVHTVFGSGWRRGNSGPASDADFITPRGLALAKESLYVADTDAGTISRVDLAAGKIIHLGITAERTGGIVAPLALALDEQAGWLYIASAAQRQIWRLDLGTNHAAHLAGTGEARAVDGPREHAAFLHPSGLVLSSDRRRLYVADGALIRWVDLPGNTVMTLGSASESLRDAVAMALTPAGLVIADRGGHALCGINPRHGTVTVMWRGSGADSLLAPSGVAFDRTDRSFVVVDTGNDRLVRVARDASRASPIVVRFP